MATAMDVGRWMLEEVNKGPYLQQYSAAHDISKMFGEQFTHTNSLGGLAINTNVLEAFRKLAPESVVWERADKIWRRRKPSDKPGRQQE
jgi:hypothetical protein